MDTSILYSYAKQAWDYDLQPGHYTSLLKEGRTTWEMINQRVQSLCHKLETNLNLNNLSELYEVHAYCETHITQRGCLCRYTARVKVLERVARRVTSITFQEDAELMASDVRIKFHNLVINY